MASGPKGKAEPGTRERFLESTIFLMRRAGLSGAGINQVLKHSGAPKGSMYYHFPGGKLEMAAAALKLYGERVADAFENLLASRRRPGEKIRALFRGAGERLAQAGFEISCAAGAVSLDLDAAGSSIQPVIDRVFASWRSVVARHIVLRSRKCTESFAGLVLTAVEGAYIRGRGERSTRAFLEAGEWLAVLAERESARALRRRA